MYDMGLSFDREKTLLDWNIIGKNIIMVVIMFGVLYSLTTIGYRFFNTYCSQVYLAFPASVYSRSFSAILIVSAFLSFVFLV